MASLLLFLVPLVLLWVLLVRPQQQRMRQAQAMVASLQVGDEVITAGGIYGTITAADATSLWLEIAPGVVVRSSRSAVSSRVVTTDLEVDDDVDDDLDMDDLDDEVDDEEEAVEATNSERARRDDDA